MKIILLIGIFLSAVVLLACASKSTPVEKSQPPDILSQPRTITKEAWEAEWEKTLAEAKKENKVAIYTSISPGVKVGLGEAFKRKYGIDIEFTVGRPAELQQKLFTERKNGIYTADIGILGLATYGTLKDMLEKLDSLLVLPEVKDTSVWFEGRVPFTGKEHNILAFSASATGQLAINTDIVKKDEIRFFRDLLNPRWKGKILLDDPTVPGPAGQIVAVILVRHGEDKLRELLSQQPIIIRDSRLQAEWVARGKYPVAMGPREPVREMMRAGAPIAYQSVEDTMYLSGSASFLVVFNKAPHPNATKVFVNWLLSREGQTIYTRFSELHSARVDVDTSLVEPSKFRDPAIKYFSVISDEWEAVTRAKYDPLIMDIFAPLLR